MACSASREAEAGRVSASRAGGHAPRTRERVARKSASRACFCGSASFFILRILSSVGAWGCGERCLAPAGPSDPQLNLETKGMLNESQLCPTATFYMYDQPELDHGWMKTCEGFAELADSVASEKLAEVGLRSQLLHHPLRVRNPAKAAIFYLPIFEATSSLLGEQPAGRLRNCSKAVPSALLRSHHSRMAAAAAVLAVSPHWQRCRGCDHVFLSSHTDSPGAVQHI